MAKEKILQHALGDDDKLIISPSKVAKAKPTLTEQRDEMFMLPPLKSEESKFKTEISEDEEEDEEEELCPKRSYDVNINQIDVTSSQFKNLPAEMRHDILTDIKETRKQNMWGRLKELPVESNDFSSYQMTRLLRRRQVQIGLEAAEQEMGGKTWSLTELEALLSEDGVLEASSKHAQKIASNENARFLLVRDITKAMNDVKKENVAGPSTSTGEGPSTSEFPSSSEGPSTSHAVQSIPIENLDDEDLDLQRAIQLSLGNDPGEVIEDATAPTDDRIKLNPQQRQKFAGTIQSHGLVRGFMMEYAEMNDDDIKDLIEATQVPQSDDLDDSYRKKFPNTDEYVLYGSPEKITEESKEKTKFSSESESDDEPQENANDSVVIAIDADLNDFNKDDDLFADVFETSTQKVSDDVPDVEVASISSDDDTIPYEIIEQDSKDAKDQKEVESGFVSEEGKVEVIDDLTNNEASESDKFWGNLNDDSDVLETGPQVDQEKPAGSPQIHQQPELSANEQFWADTSNEIFVIGDKEQKTPTKASRASSPAPAKVASPFFVNRKTPSSKKKQDDQPIIIPSDSVAKSLFPDRKVIEDPAMILQKAAQDLRKNKTHEELESMKKTLVEEQKNLAQERNKMDRMGTSITESMNRDCKELLKLFGIPYIESPMEAEAQCAFLEIINLTDGTISDDSDYWLFGGQTVYKNFFVQKKIVQEFKNENIEQMFHLDRKKLIQLAMLVGSDYTIGINGIGAVTALEILAAFPPTSETENSTDQYQSLVSSLRKFREWFQNGKQPGPGGRTILKSKLKNVELFEGFPSLNIAKAYLEPIVDKNAEKFTWGLLDTESLVEYAKAKLGWTRMKTEEILAPVLKRLNEKKQSTIKDYFKSQVAKKFFDNKTMSKRVQKAVGKMGGAQDEEPEKEEKKTRKRKLAPKKPKREDKGADDQNVVDLCDDDDVDEALPEKSSSPEVPKHSKPEPSTSKVVEKKPKKAKAEPRKRKLEDSEPSTSGTTPSNVKKRAPRIPETKQVIPQREKDKEEQERMRLKAIEIFKKSKAAPKKN